MMFYLDKPKEEVLSEIRSEVCNKLSGFQYASLTNLDHTIEQAINAGFEKLFAHMRPESELDQIILKD